MSFNTMSQTRPGSIFDVGSFVGRLGDVAIDTFAKIAPVWAINQLDLQETLNKATPTFQQTTSEQLRDANLTTQPVVPNPTTPGATSVQGSSPDRSGGTLLGNTNTNTVLLIGAGVIAGIFFLSNR